MMVGEYDILVNLTIEEAQAELPALGLESIRVVRHNGRAGLATADYRPRRVNVATYDSPRGVLIEGVRGVG